MFRAQRSCYSLNRYFRAYYVPAGTGHIGRVDTLCTCEFYGLARVQICSHASSTVWQVLWYRLTKGVMGTERTPRVECTHMYMCIHMAYIQANLLGTNKLSIKAWRISRNYPGWSGTNALKPHRQNFGKFSVAALDLKWGGWWKVRIEKYTGHEIRGFVRHMKDNPGSSEFEGTDSIKG